MTTEQPTQSPIDSRQDESELLKRIASGDEAAFGAFCDRYTPLIYSTAYKVLNHCQDAQHLAHDVL